MDMSIKLFQYFIENETNFFGLEEIDIDNGETKLVVKAKLFLDTNKQLEDLEITLKCLEHVNKKS